MQGTQLSVTGIGLKINRWTPYARLSARLASKLHSILGDRYGACWLAGWLAAWLGLAVLPRVATLGGRKGCGW
jgi:hypothetical protein